MAKSKSKAKGKGAKAKSKSKGMSEKAEAKLSPAALAKVEAMEAAMGQSDGDEGAQPPQPPMGAGPMPPDAMPHPYAGAQSMISGQQMPPHPQAGVNPMMG